MVNSLPKHPAELSDREKSIRMRIEDVLQTEIPINDREFQAYFDDLFEQEESVLRAKVQAFYADSSQFNPKRKDNVNFDYLTMPLEQIYLSVYCRHISTLSSAVDTLWYMGEGKEGSDAEIRSIITGMTRAMTTLVKLGLRTDTKLHALFSNFIDLVIAKIEAEKKLKVASLEADEKSKISFSPELLTSINATFHPAKIADYDESAEVYHEILDKIYSLNRQLHSLFNSYKIPSANT